MWLLLLWLLLLSGHKSGEKQEGEGGERRASTRRPARTRHCVCVRCSVRSLRQAARTGVMEHPQAVMGEDEQEEDGQTVPVAANLGRY